MALTALYNLSFTPGMETGNEETGNDDKDQLVPGMYRTNENIACHPWLKLRLTYRTFPPNGLFGLKIPPREWRIQ